MATGNPTLADWVKNAYSMEMSLVTMLEKQAQDVKTDPQLQQGLNRHLEATRRHVDLLRDRLAALGENASAVRPANPLASIYGQSNGGGQDQSLRTELLDFVTESFEVASYRALGALATHLGDHETARVCQQILRDETAMVRALDEIVPGLRSAESAATPEVGATPKTGQDNVRIARENFEAINAHDADRWLRLTSDDYCGEAPATTGSMDRQQNRDYLNNFFRAFPDLRFQLLRVIASGDHVDVDWSATGTQTGPLISPDGKTIPPTRRSVTEYGSTTFECKDGKIRRTWVYFDMSALMDQLGLTPRA